VDKEWLGLGGRERRLFDSPRRMLRRRVGKARTSRCSFCNKGVSGKEVGKRLSTFKYTSSKTTFPNRDLLEGVFQSESS
jgi:hypothetical protein